MTHFDHCSRRMQAVQQPIIPQITQWMHENPGTLSLGQGIVSYPPPARSFEAMYTDSNRSFQQYRAVAGETALLMEIEQKLAQDNRVSLDSYKQTVIVTAGSNMAFILALYTITTPGDEIILLSPFYFNHDMAINMLACTTVAVATYENHQPNLAKIQSAITKKTRAIVTVSPNNPTGAVYSKQALTEINHLCKTQGIYHISDEAYEYFVYDDAEHFSPASIEHSEQHTISLYSLSKAYGLASLRVGYALLPKQLQKAALKVQDTQLICVPILSQLAALGALQTGKAYCVKHLPELSDKRDMLCSELDTAKDCIEYQLPQGAFYYYLKIDTQIPAKKLCHQLIKHYQIAVIPAETFGESNQCCLRVSFGALDHKQTEIAIKNLITGIKRLTVN